MVSKLISVVFFVVRVAINTDAEELPPRGACAIDSCTECLEKQGCGWYTLRGTGGMPGCYDATEAPSSVLYEKAKECNLCNEAATCSDCMKERECSWFVPRSGNVMGQTCSKSNAFDKVAMLWQKTVDSCPVCAANTCESCVELSTSDRPDQDTSSANATEDMDASNATDNICAWSVLKGLKTNGRCTTPTNVFATHSIVDECNSGSALSTEITLIIVALVVFGIM